MAGRQPFAPRDAGALHKISEFDPLVAADAGNGRLAGARSRGKIVDHRFAKPLFVSST